MEKAFAFILISWYKNNIVKAFDNRPDENFTVLKNSENWWRNWEKVRVWKFLERKTLKYIYFTIIYLFIFYRKTSNSLNILQHALNVNLEK